MEVTSVKFAKVKPSDAKFLVLSTYGYYMGSYPSVEKERVLYMLKDDIQLLSFPSTSHVSL